MSWSNRTGPLKLRSCDLVVSRIQQGTLGMITCLQLNGKSSVIGSGDRFMGSLGGECTCVCACVVAHAGVWVRVCMRVRVLVAKQCVRGR